MTDRNRLALYDFQDAAHELYRTLRSELPDDVWADLPSYLPDGIREIARLIEAGDIGWRD